MSEISREEIDNTIQAINKMGIGRTNNRELEEKVLYKAISDMEKLEKIEKFVNEESCDGDCDGCVIDDSCDTYKIRKIINSKED